LKLLIDGAHSVALLRLLHIINDMFTEEVLPQIQSCTFLDQLQGMAPCTITCRIFEKCFEFDIWYSIDYTAVLSKKAVSTILVKNDMTTFCVFYTII